MELEILIYIEGLCLSNGSWFRDPTTWDDRIKSYLICVIIIKIPLAMPNINIINVNLLT